MPVRIYSLAKELDYDSKKLVDVCKQAGITGKGSALASLSDDEVQQVKDYLNQGPASASETTTTETPTKPDSPPRGPIKVVSSARPISSPLGSRSRNSDDTAVEESEATVEDTDTEEQPDIPPEPLDRTGVQVPRRRTGIKVIGRSQSPTEENGDEKLIRKPSDRSRNPVIKLATMPDAPAAPAAKTDDEKTVKPEMSLSEALKSKMGKTRSRSAS